MVNTYRSILYIFYPAPIRYCFLELQSPGTSPVTCQLLHLNMIRILRVCPQLYRRPIPRTAIICISTNFKPKICICLSRCKREIFRCCRFLCCFYIWCCGCFRRCLDSFLCCCFIWRCYFLCCRNI